MFTSSAKSQVKPLMLLESLNGISGENEIHLNKVSLETVLSQTGNSSVSIVSLVGYTSRGFSLFVGYVYWFLQSMENPKNEHKLWLKNPFTWENEKSLTRNRVGTWVYGRPFCIKIKHQEFAIILTFTQCSKKDFLDCNMMSSIFGLNMCTSSTMVIYSPETLCQQHLSQVITSMKDSLTCVKNSKLYCEELTFIISDSGCSGGEDEVFKCFEQVKQKYPESINEFNTNFKFVHFYPVSQIEIDTDFETTVASLNSNFINCMKHVSDDLIRRLLARLQNNKKQSSGALRCQIQEYMSAIKDKTKTKNSNPVPLLRKIFSSSKMNEFERHHNPQEQNYPKPAPRTNVLKLPRSEEMKSNAVETPGIQNHIPPIPVPRPRKPVANIAEIRPHSLSNTTKWKVCIDVNSADENNATNQKANTIDSNVLITAQSNNNKSCLNLPMETGCVVKHVKYQQSDRKTRREKFFSKTRWDDEQESEIKDKRKNIKTAVNRNSEAKTERNGSKSRCDDDQESEEEDKIKYKKPNVTGNTEPKNERTTSKSQWNDDQDSELKDERTNKKPTVIRSSEAKKEKTGCKSRWDDDQESEQEDKRKNIKTAGNINSEAKKEKTRSKSRWDDDPESEEEDKTKYKKLTAYRNGGHNKERTGSKSSWNDDEDSGQEDKKRNKKPTVNRTSEAEKERTGSTSRWDDDPESEDNKKYKKPTVYRNSGHKIERTGSKSPWNDDQVSEQDDKKSNKKTTVNRNVEAEKERTGSTSRWNDDQESEDKKKYKKPTVYRNSGDNKEKTGSKSPWNDDQGSEQDDKKTTVNRNGEAETERTGSKSGWDIDQDTKGEHNFKGKNWYSFNNEDVYNGIPTSKSRCGNGQDLNFDSADDLNNGIFFGRDRSAGTIKGNVKLKERDSDNTKQDEASSNFSEVNDIDSSSVERNNALYWSKILNYSNMASITEDQTCCKDEIANTSNVSEFSGNRFGTR